jgi:hypothetical protein
MPQERDRYGLHAFLFILTLCSTVVSGAQMTGRTLVYAESLDWWMVFGMRISLPWLLDGLRFGLSLLLFLTVHEFGHWFAARHHRVRTSLPYYIPFPFNGIGTFGAVIRIREPIPGLRALFDIGVSGPVAGFVVALGVLIVGVATLPGPEYMMGMPGHEALKQYISAFGSFPSAPLPVPEEEGLLTLTIGSTPLYWLISQFGVHVPPMWEMYHYPILFAGWLGLFFTALNLLPVGQLDGGHVLYALVGPVWHARLARAFVMLLLVSGGLGFVDEASGVLTAWLPWLPGAPWVVLALVLYAYLHRIFEGHPIHILIGASGITLAIALLSRIPSAVASLGYSGWLVWCLLIVVFIKVDHPPVLYMEPLTPARRRLAYAAIIIFFLCFSIRPLYVA